MTYGELLSRVRCLGGGLGVEPGDRVALVLDNRLETALLYWACQWVGAVAVPLSWRLSDEELHYCLGDCGASVVVRDGDQLPDGPEHPGALDRDERETSLLLYTSGTTGRPKGVPRSHAADRAGGWSQALQHGYRFGERTLGVMPLYHTMGIHSLVAMHVVGGCFVTQRPMGPGRGAAAGSRSGADHLASTSRRRSSTTSSTTRTRARDVSSVRALGYAGAAMTSSARRALCGDVPPDVFVNHYGSTEIYTFTIGGDQRAKPGCAGRSAVNARLRRCATRGDRAALELRRGVRGLLEPARRRREGDPGRLVRDGRHGAPRRGRRPLGRRPRRRHDRLRRRERPSARGRGRARAHPGVGEVAVIGAADERWDSASSPSWSGDATAEELDAHCLASSLARFKRPREYRLVASSRSPHRGRSCAILRDETGATA